MFFFFVFDDEKNTKVIKGGCRTENDTDNNIKVDFSSDNISIEYYNDLKCKILEKLGDSYKFDERCKEITLSDNCDMFDLDYYNCFVNETSEIGTVFIWNREYFYNDFLNGDKSLLYTNSYEPKGPRRTAAMLFHLLKGQKYQLIPALIIICAKDLYGVAWVRDAAYKKLREFAEEELKADGFNPNFIYQAHYYISDFVYEINKKYKIDELKGPSCEMDCRKHLYQEPEKLADYYAEHFRNEFDNCICLFLHKSKDYMGKVSKRAADIMSDLLSSSCEE